MTSFSGDVARAVGGFLGKNVFTDDLFTTVTVSATALVGFNRLAPKIESEANLTDCTVYRIANSPGWETETSVPVSLINFNVNPSRRHREGHCPTTPGNYASDTYYTVPI